MKEVETLRRRLSKHFDSNAAQIWTGDFNALTKEDYTAEQWQEVTNVRARNSWELPMTGVTTEVRGE